MTAQASAPARLARPLTIEEYQRISHAHRLTVAQNLVNAQHAAEAQAKAIANVRAEALRKLADAEAKVAAEFADRTAALDQARTKLAAVTEACARVRAEEERALDQLTAQRKAGLKRLNNERARMTNAIAAAEAHTARLRPLLAVALEDEGRIEDAYQDAKRRVRVNWRKLQGRNTRLRVADVPEVGLPAEVVRRLATFERELDAFHRGRSKAS